MTFLYALATLWSKLKQIYITFFSFDKIFVPATQGHKLVYARQTFLAILFCFILFSNAQAQSAQERADAGLNDVKPLQIGDTIPEELWRLPLQVVNHPDGKDTITLSDYRGKLIILDFWETWCKPCVFALETKQNLFIHYQNDIMFLPSSQQSEKTLYTFLNQRDWNYKLSHYNGRKLASFFNFTAVPYLVWIKDGKIIATTGAEALSEANIQQLIGGTSFEMVQVDQDSSIDTNFPVQERNQLLSVKIGGTLADRSSRFKNKPHGLSAHNLTFAQLVQQIYSIEVPKSETNSRLRWQVDSITKAGLYRSTKYTGDYTHDLDLQEWQKKNRFCIDIQLSTVLNTERSYLLKLLEDNLKSYLQLTRGITFGLETKKEDVLRISPLPDFWGKQAALAKKLNKKSASSSTKSAAQFVIDVRKSIGDKELPLVLDNSLQGTNILVPEIHNIGLQKIREILIDAGLQLTKSNQEINVIVIKPINH